jgi:two-component system, LytTR family, response regulator
MTAIIVDDEDLARKRIEYLLQKYKHEIEIVAQIDDGNDAIFQINRLKPEVVFLDIKLSDMTGFDVIKALQEPLPFIIFTTAYADFALQAFDSMALDYLVKPIDQDRFEKSILKLKSVKNNTSLAKEKILELQDVFTQSKPKTNTLSISIGNKILLIPHKDISHVSADDKYTNVHTINGKKYLCNKTLAILENTLPENFIRIHRSYVVNFDHVQQIQKFIKGRFAFVMNNTENTSLISSDGYREKMKEKLGL